MSLENFSDWRKMARDALAAKIPPEQMNWQVEPSLFPDVMLLPTHSTRLECPKRFLEMAQTISYHRSPERWGLLYSILWEIASGNRGILQDTADPRMYRAGILFKQVRRDLHKMTAFVRFEKFRSEPEAFYAWYEPDHRILEPGAAFFRRRFGAMNWAIMTPHGGVAWDQRQLTHIAGPLRKPRGSVDHFDELWQTYFASIFNPARLKIQAMKKEMPVRFWKNLPEAELIPELIAQSSRRVKNMIEKSQDEAAQITRATAIATTVDELREKVKTCQACDLCHSQRPGVPSVGPEKSRIMIVGEQPGDQEDFQGKPFVGPAGQLLRALLGELAVGSCDLYFTNAVKHFRFELKGKMRLHLKPQTFHIKACRPWLEKEISLVSPEIIVCLGSTAAHSVLGYALPVKEARLRRDLETAGGTPVRVAWHPSAILRANAETAAQLREQLKQDLATYLVLPT